MADIERESYPPRVTETDVKPSIEYVETTQAAESVAGWNQKLPLTDGDVALALFENPDQLGEPINPIEERKLIRKVDMLILPCLVVCYSFYYLDKTTLSYAAIFGIREDLHLVGTDYSWLSSVFYFGWLAWVYPTNILMQRFPVGKYLAVNIFLWGALLMAQAGAKSFTTLAVLRALSGAAEGCSDSAFMLITAMWYTRREQPVRIGLWYAANGIGNSLGGLLGYAIGHISGSLPSWKYEFLIIGALCAIWGIVLFIFLPDSPVTAKFLSQTEKRIAVERLRGNQTGVENKHFKWYQVREAVLDYKTYFFFLIAFFANVPNGGISNFGTIIIQGFGYSTLVTTLLSIPYGVIIVLSILSCVYLNDRFPVNNRWRMAVIYLLPSVAGAFGLRFVPHDSKVARLIMYYLTGPQQGAFVLVLSMFTANTAGHTKKVITSATLILGLCAGNIAGPFFYKQAQAPGYSLGIVSMIVGYSVEVCLILILAFLLARDNRARDAMQGIGRIRSANIEDTEPAEHPEEDFRDLNATAFADMTDRENLNFRYVF